MPKLQIKILEDKQSLGRTTAEHAARSLRVAIRDRGLARIIAGASQFEFLEALTRAPDIDWAKVELFTWTNR
jgi:glucosamine-6-phosphate deaminase